MTNVITFLQGKKTYIISVVIAALVCCRLCNLIDQNTFLSLIGLCGAGGIATLRSAVDNLGKSK